MTSSRGYFTSVWSTAEMYGPIWKTTGDIAILDLDLSVFIKISVQMVSGNSWIIYLCPVYNYKLVCLEERVELLLFLDCHCRHCAKTYSKNIKGINTKLGILAHHNKVHLQDKGHNSEMYFLLKMSSRMMATDMSFCTACSSLVYNYFNRSWLIYL